MAVEINKIIKYSDLPASTAQENTDILSVEKADGAFYKTTRSEFLQGAVGGDLSYTDTGKTASVAVSESGSETGGNAETKIIPVPTATDVESQEFFTQTTAFFSITVGKTSTILVALSDGRSVSLDCSTLQWSPITETNPDDTSGREFAGYDWQTAQGNVLLQIGLKYEATGGTPKIHGADAIIIFPYDSTGSNVDKTAYPITVTVTNPA